MKKYLDFYDKFVKKMINWNFKDSQTAALFPYNFYYDFIKEFSRGRMQEDDYDEIMTHLKKIKQKDPERLFQQGVADFDEFMIKFLPKYRGVIAKTKIYVKHAFSACDLDGNGMCDNQEFHTMFKYIEPGTFSQ